MFRRVGGIGLFLLGSVLTVSMVRGMFANPTPRAMAVPVANATPIVPEKVKPTNPDAEPGRVHWHATFEQALAAATLSKKPVFVFHMMGQLDHQFC